MKKQYQNTVFFLSAIAVITMILIERILSPGYWIKSLLKILVFSMPVILVSLIYKRNIKNILFIRKIGINRKTVLFLLLFYFLVILGYFLIKDMIDLTSIRESLLNKEGVNERNFYLVFSYIILVNSFLEEAFFRAFLFGSLRQRSVLFGHIVSSLLFSVYHIGIMASWFSPGIFLLFLAGLVLAGAFLNILFERGESVFSSWIFHACANLAINTIASFMILMI